MRYYIVIHVLKKKFLNLLAYIFPKADIIIIEEGTHWKSNHPIDNTTT